MALIFHPNIRNLFMGRGIRAAFSSPFSITVYRETQPSSSAIISDWQSYNAASGNMLVHFTGAGWTQPSEGILLQLTIPPPQVAIQNGLATWAILWNTAVSLSAVQGSTLPSQQFMVVPASSALENGVIRFLDPQISAGDTISITDGSLGAYIA